MDDDCGPDPLRLVYHARVRAGTTRDATPAEVELMREGVVARVREGDPSFADLHDDEVDEIAHQAAAVGGTPCPYLEALLADAPTGDP